MIYRSIIPRSIPTFLRIRDKTLREFIAIETILKVVFAQEKYLVNKGSVIILLIDIEAEHL